MTGGVGFVHPTPKVRQLLQEQNFPKFDNTQTARFPAISAIPTVIGNKQIKSVVKTLVFKAISSLALSNSMH